MTPYWSDMLEFFLDSLVLIFPAIIKIELRLRLILVVKFIKMVFSISATMAILFVWSHRSKIHRPSNINGPSYIHSFRFFFHFFALMRWVTGNPRFVCIFVCWAWCGMKFTIAELHFFGSIFSTVPFFNWSCRIDHISWGALYLFALLLIIMSVVWEFLVYLLSLAIVDNIFPIVFHSLIEVFRGFCTLCFYPRFFNSYRFRLLILFDVALHIVDNWFAVFWKRFKLWEDARGICQHPNDFVNQIIVFCSYS